MRDFGGFLVSDEIYARVDMPAFADIDFDKQSLAQSEFLSEVDVLDNCPLVVSEMGSEYD